MQGDLAAQMVEGIHQFLLRRTQEAAQERGRACGSETITSVEDYNRSVSPNRERFRQIIGAVDPRMGARPPNSWEPWRPQPRSRKGPATKCMPSVGRFLIEWLPTLADWMPKDCYCSPMGNAVARVVAIPDADWTPEMLVGWRRGFRRRLSSRGGSRKTAAR